MNHYIPKEISWLSFNERVLQEAENKEVPLHERFKFMGIYSNNLDEYFRVRVATLKRLTTLGTKAKLLLGYNPASVLKRINEIVQSQNIKFEKNYSALLKELESHDIYMINEKQLNDGQVEFVSEYFHQQVRPRLMPFLLEKGSVMPNFTDDAIFLRYIFITQKPKKRDTLCWKFPQKCCPVLFCFRKREIKNI